MSVPRIEEVTQHPAYAELEPINIAEIIPGKEEKGQKIRIFCYRSGNAKIGLILSSYLEEVRLYSFM